MNNQTINERIIEENVLMGNEAYFESYLIKEGLSGTKFTK